MPLAERKRERVHQVARWLREEFPLPYPDRVVVRHGDRKLHGYCNVLPSPRRVFIFLNAVSTKDTLIETLMHEWAHARAMKVDPVETVRHLEGRTHDDEFWLEFGRIFRRYHDEGGRLESGRF